MVILGSSCGCVDSRLSIQRVFSYRHFNVWERDCIILSNMRFHHWLDLYVNDKGCMYNEYFIKIEH